MRNAPPILVTGSHRSGTTWIGRTLAYAPGTAYVHEPFNPVSDRGYCAADFDGEYTYITNENEARYRDALDDTVALKYRPAARVRSGRRPRSLLVAAVRWALFLCHRVLGHRPILKDPLALFSAPWFASTYGVHVIVAIRHPAAFAGSLKAKGWPTRFDFRWLLNQPALMRDVLGPFKNEIRSMTYTGAGDGSIDPVDEAILLWRILYTVISDYRRRFPDWVFVRHEDFSRAPVASFERLFDRLGLDMNARIADKIRQDTRSGDEAETFNIQRNARANITRWKSRLDSDEIARIREGTADVWPLFYDDGDW